MRRKSWPWLALLLWLLWLRAFWASGPSFAAVRSGDEMRATAQQVLQMRVFGKYGDFSVVEAQIIGFSPDGCPDTMEVDIDGVSFLVHKEDITNSKKPWDLLDVFSIGEVVKLCATNIFSNPHWSMRALERTPGAVLVNKTKVLEEANATLARARQFYHAWPRPARPRSTRWWRERRMWREQIHNVTVSYVGAFGARVRTQDGFLGMISANDLGSKLRKLRVGERLAVQTLRVNPKNTFQVNPRKMRDYPLIFSYSNQLKLELREKYDYKEGDVVEAKVVSLQPASMVVEIDDVPFALQKDDISATTNDWEPAQTFAVDEVVKAVWVGDGILMRALERWPGEMIEDTSQVLREAEDRVKELESAWDRLVRSYETGLLGLNVTVTSVEGWGACVRTEDGIAGLILGRSLGSKTPCVGEHLMVSIIELRPEYRFNDSPRMISEYPMTAAYLDYNKLELAQRYTAGDVAEATIVGFTAAAMDVEVDGMPFCVKKVDITGSKNRTWDLLDVFDTGEVVKLYCMSSRPSSRPELRWSMRALEVAPGAVLVNKTDVFERAEETAKLFREKPKAAEDDILDILGLRPFL